MRIFYNYTHLFNFEMTDFSPAEKANAYHIDNQLIINIVLA